MSNVIRIEERDRKFKNLKNALKKSTLIITP